MIDTDSTTASLSTFLRFIKRTNKIVLYPFPSVVVSESFHVWSSPLLRVELFLVFFDTPQQTHTATHTTTTGSCRYIFDDNDWYCRSTNLTGSAPCCHQVSFFFVGCILTDSRLGDRGEIQEGRERIAKSSCPRGIALTDNRRLCYGGGEGSSRFIFRFGSSLKQEVGGGKWRRRRLGGLGGGSAPGVPQRQFLFALLIYSNSFHNISIEFSFGPSLIV